MARYDPVEALFLVRRALQREPDFVAAMTLLRYDFINFYSPGLDFDDADLFEHGLARVAELLPESPERQWIEAMTPEAIKGGATAERLKSLLAARPDDFELALQTAALSPDFVQRLAALRALPPPLGADPRIDMPEAGLRVYSGELPEVSRVIDRGLAEARRRDDRLIMSWFLGQRAVVEIKDGRTDDGVNSFLEAEREALAAGSSSFARQLRFTRAHLVGLGGAGRFTAASQLYRQLRAGRTQAWERLRIEAETNAVTRAHPEHRGDLRVAQERRIEE